MRILSCLAMLALALSATAQERPLPPASRTPVLQLAQEGPASAVASAAFSPDGSTLYVGGYDKIVRVYARVGGQFKEVGPLRLPVGPGNAGAVNAVVVSPDGQWIAVAGRAPMRDETAFGQDGLVVDAKHLPGPMVRDLGVIYLFAANKPNGGKVLRGHQGEVRSLAFADPSPAGGPVLVSASVERAPNGQFDGLVRVWDLTTSKEIISRTGLPSTRARPGLAAWPAGDGPKDFRVAIAWQKPDPKSGGELILWDVAANKVSPFDDGALNLPLGVRRGPKGSAVEVISGGFTNFGIEGQRQFGRLSIRSLIDGESRTIDFPFADGKHTLPLAVATAGQSLAALLETTPAPAGATNRPTELRLFGSKDELKAKVELTGVDRRGVPFLTASPDGRFLAVGGFANQRLEVFDVAALADGKEVRQVLPGAASGFASVAFLTGPKLWLGSTAEAPGRGGIAFDFVTGKVTETVDRADLDAPTTTAKFLFNTPPQKPATVAVEADGRKTLLALRGSQVPTVTAYLPANPVWKKTLGPIIAVAHTDEANAVTIITLYDGVTGRRLRKLVGPEQSVRALAFSAARPFLAAVSGDRTVSVWSLKDLDRATGVIEGVHVTDGDKGVVVAAIEPDAPKSSKEFAVGDVIEAVGGEKGKLDPVKKAADFRWEVRSRPIGGTVGVQVAGKPARVVLPVGRGVEEHGPLFSLWIGNGAKPADRSWVGWSPSGLYDASSQAAEARIGWLTATGDPTAPTTFAGADQYRKAYYRKDVLRFLAEKGELLAALDAYADAYPPPPPRLRAQFAGAGLPPGATAIRTKAVTLQVQLTELTDEFPLERAVLEWRDVTADRVPGGSRQIPLVGQKWPIVIDLANHPWTRGKHSFEIALRRTPTAEPATVYTVTVTFIPLAPTLTALVGGKPVKGLTIAADGDSIAVSASIESPSGEAVDAALVWSDPEGKTGVIPLPDVGKGAFGPVEVKLKPGATFVRLTAVNRGAGEFAERESDAVVFDVTYAPPKIVVPPQIGRMVVAPLGEGRTIEERTVDRKPLLVSDSAKVRLTTVLSSEEPIASIEWNDGNGTWTAVPLDPTNPRKMTTTREVVLPLPKEKESRTIRVRAKSARSEFGEGFIEIAYHPPLPTVRVDELPVGPSGTVTNRDVVISGTVGGNAAEVPFQIALVSVAVGNPSKTFAATVDLKAGTWKAAVSLDPKVNKIDLIVRNAWRKEVQPSFAQMTYLRKPKLLGVKPVDAGDRAVADIVATVETADGLEPTVLLVNGRPADTAPPKKLMAQAGVVVWEVTALAVPVKVGTEWLDSLRVSVRNADGDSEPMTVAVKRKAISLRQAVVALEDGLRNRIVEVPKTTVGFKVTSDTPLTSVVVEQASGAAGRFEQVTAVDLAKAVATADGVALTAQVPVELREGVNQFRISAVNAGGNTPVEFTLSRTSAAVQIIVDSVDELAPNGTVVRRLARSEAPGITAFDGALSGFAVVRGRIHWASEANPLQRDPILSAVLFANQVGHLPVQLLPPASPGADREFVAPVFLNAADTHVHVEIRTGPRGKAVPQQATGGDFQIRCKNPLTQQRLHLVVVGVDVPKKDTIALVQRVVESLGGTVPPEKVGRFDFGYFQAGAFAEAFLYPPVIWDVDSGNVGTALDVVGNRVDQLSRGVKGGWVNDVILLYYQGEDWIGDDGRRWLHTTYSKKYPKAVAWKDAVRVDALPKTPGVRLLLLNVVSPQPGQPAGDAVAVGPPLLRYVWKDGAAVGRLFPLLSKAVAEQPTLGQIADAVRSQISSDSASAGQPVEVLPAELRPRRLGMGRP